MRRIMQIYNVPSETAINKAVEEIELMGADEKLTKAQNLLKEAKELVSNYVDEQFKTLNT